MILRELLPDVKFTEARAVGGGARSIAWSQIKADVLNIPYQRLSGTEFGTWGAAMIAGKATGFIADLPAHAQDCAVRDGKALQPSQDNHELYAPIIGRYVTLEGMLDRYFAPEHTMYKPASTDV